MFKYRSLLRSSFCFLKATLLSRKVSWGGELLEETKRTAYVTIAGFLAYVHSRPTLERAGMERERVKKVNQIESI